MIHILEIVWATLSIMISTWTSALFLFEVAVLQVIVKTLMEEYIFSYVLQEHLHNCGFYSLKHEWMYFYEIFFARNLVQILETEQHATSFNMYIKHTFITTIWPN